VILKKIFKKNININLNIVLTDLHCIDRKVDILQNLFLSSTGG